MQSVILSFTFLFFLTLNYNARADWIPVHEKNSKTVIIFVHGLTGDPSSSFRNPKTKKSWPELMKSDTKSLRGAPPLSSYSIGHIGYPSKEQDRLSSPEITTRSLFFLEEEGVLDKYDNIIFVAYSYGGIIVKDMITNAWRRNKILSQKVQAVFLISVPSKGAPLANWYKVISKSPLVVDAQTIEKNSYLSRLDRDWENYIRQRSISRRPRIYCAYEKKRTNGLFIVPVPSTATTCDSEPWPANKNHFEIAQPENTRSFIYRWVRNGIAELAIAKKISIIENQKEIIYDRKKPHKQTGQKQKPIIKKIIKHQTRTKCPQGSIKIGQSKIVGSVRHRTCNYAPSWSEIVSRLPQVKFGRLSDAGTGRRWSRSCNQKVATRRVRYTATKLGKEAMRIFGDRAYVHVCGK